MAPLTAREPSASPRAAEPLTAVRRSWGVRVTDFLSFDTDISVDSPLLQLHVEHFTHLRHQFRLLVGFGQVSVRACLTRFLAMLLPGARSDHDDRDMPQPRIGA